MELIWWNTTNNTNNCDQSSRHADHFLCELFGFRLLSVRQIVFQDFERKQILEKCFASICLYWAHVFLRVNFEPFLWSGINLLRLNVEPFLCFIDFLLFAQMCIVYCFHRPLNAFTLTDFDSSFPFECIHCNTSMQNEEIYKKMVRNLRWIKWNFDEKNYIQTKKRVQK